jgi:hypothetical protein
LARSTNISGAFAAARWIGARQLQPDRPSPSRHIRKRGLQAALRRAIAGQPRLARAEVLDVVGQLVVQEGGGVVAGDRDQAEVGDGRDESGGEVGRVRRAAEVFDLRGFASVEAGAQGGQVRSSCS